MKSVAVVAQGAGFYGCSLFTLPIEKKARVQEVLENTRGSRGFGPCGFDGAVLVEEVPFECPEPHTLFDTGASSEELEVLHKIRALI